MYGHSSLNFTNVSLQSYAIYFLILNVISDCESLIRKMLVLEPNKRYSIPQIKKHRWMQMGSIPTLPPTIAVSNTQPNEQILRLMQSLGIDSAKTREVR